MNSYQGDYLNAFMINTVAEGHNSGRTYYLQASSKDHCLELVRSLKTLAKRAREKVEAHTRLAKLQLRIRKVFNSPWFQTTSAILIIAVTFQKPQFCEYMMKKFDCAQNFLVSIFEAQYGSRMTLGNGSTTELGQMTDELNLAFSVIFSIELLVNVWAHWPTMFISNAWVSATRNPRFDLQFFKNILYPWHYCLTRKAASRSVAIKRSFFCALICSLTCRSWLNGSSHADLVLFCWAELAGRLHRQHVHPRLDPSVHSIVAGTSFAN